MLLDIGMDLLDINWQLKKISLKCKNLSDIFFNVLIILFTFATSLNHKTL